MCPDDLKYSPEHQWVRMETDGMARIGITFFAQQQMHDLVYIDLNPVGSAVKAGQPYGSMESVKAVSDINSPLTGEIVEINDTLEDAPQQINNDPYGDGWTIRIRVADPGEMSRLIEKDAYIAYAEEIAAKRKPKEE